MANYKTEDIEGIGAVKGKKFREAGVKNDDGAYVLDILWKQYSE